jgi:hypothetical protein
VTGTTPRRRPTDEQRQLAEQWLAQTGRAVTAEAVAELAPHVRVTGKPEPHEVQAFARLVRRGQVPTAGAVRGEMASRSASAARRRQLEQTRAATVADLTGTGPAAAAYVRGYRERTGHGPSWGELGRHAGWPREVTDDLMPRLRAAGWLAYNDEPGSLRPGPAAAPRAAEVGSPVTAGPVGVDIAT